MKILWLSHFVPYPPAGGALQRSFHLLRHAAAQHEVHLLALNQPRLLSTEAAVRDSVAELSKLCASVKVFPIPAERSSLDRALAGVRSIIGDDPLDVSWLRSDPMANASRAYRTEAVDLVHTDTIGLWPYAQGFDHVPVVLGHHNIESDLILRRVAREGASWRAKIFKRDAAKLQRLERAAAERAAMNVVVSSLDGERLAEIAPSAAIEVVDNGVDTEYWKPSSNTSLDARRGIIFAGTLGWGPNRDAVEFLLADIWPALLARGGDRRLTLAGRDPPPAARAAESDSRVRVTGFVPDVRPYFDEAGIFVCPIRVGGGTRLKILDALSMAKPLVSTAIGVEGLDLIDGEHYLRAETAEDFTRQIIRLDENPDLGKRLGAAGRERVVTRYDWRVIGRQLDQAYMRARKQQMSTLGTSGTVSGPILSH